MLNSNPAINVNRPSYKAYKILYVGFVVTPLVAGVDKFFDFLVNWPIYLSPLVSNMMNAQFFWYWFLCLNTSNGMAAMILFTISC